MNNKSKITQAFAGKKAFVAFITGGDPDISTTEEIILALAQSGADIIEIGVPFSDPVAEGPVIQEADERALANGCTADDLFEMVKRVRERGVEIPLLFMSYVNPIFAYGKGRFMQKCRQSGIDGVIVPDLPFEEKSEISGECAEYNIAQVSMIAPTSVDENGRIEAIAKDAENSGGFLYCVSSLGVTGARRELGAEIGGMIGRVRRVSDVPCAVGFGISCPEQARDMAAISDGVIVGSAIVRIIAEHGRDCIEPVRRFAREIKAALR